MIGEQVLRVLRGDPAARLFDLITEPAGSPIWEAERKNSEDMESIDDVVGLIQEAM